MAEEVLSTFVHRAFAGADRRFQLRLGEVRELEEVCGAGIGAIYLRMATGQFKADDIRNTIRLGLTGGGLDRTEAEALVRFTMEDQPLNTFMPFAIDTLRAVFEGVDDAGNFGGARESQDGPATSAPSTKPAPPRDSARERSMQ